VECPDTSGLTTAPSSSLRRCRNRISAVGAKTAYIAPGSPWENGWHRESTPLAELLDGEIFYSLKEAQIVIESWRRYQQCRPPTRVPWLSAARA
jgi:hypothetical protein